MLLYNTLTKSKEIFEPLHPGKVGMYVCGPTVYDYIHIGNIRAYVFADTLRRVLEDASYEIRMIKNITDVGHLTADDIAQGDSGEDKIEKASEGALYVECSNCKKLFFSGIIDRGSGTIFQNNFFVCPNCKYSNLVKDNSGFIKKTKKRSPEEIASFYEQYFYKTEQSMNILPAHYFPRATAHIKQMIKLIEELIKKDHAYEKNGNVFLDVTSFPEYGKLSGNTLENLKVGARLEEHPDKKHPWDFALWLKAPQGHLMHWTAPWSEGYPGWHIECSAMSMEYLGDTLDIHTGGEDNIFPHHEAEIVQSEGVTGKPFVRYFLHTRHMLISGEKMSKSKENFYTLENIIERGFTPMDFRMALLGAHYRSQMNFTWEALNQARKNKETLFGIISRLDTIEDEQTRPGSFDGTKYLEQLREALQDDLNTPLALATALELAKRINMLLDQEEATDREALKKVFEKIFFLFGLASEKETIPEDVEDLAKARETARQAKDFAESDRLRDLIEKRGYRTEDIPGGYRLKKA